MANKSCDQLPEALSPFTRIVVVGTTGSGKSTLAGHLGKVLDLPVVELDAFRHGPNWEQISTDKFRDQVENALKSAKWIVDGNYGIARDLIWPRAQAVIWLDYPFTTVFRQLFWRTLKRAITREELWSGNRESWRRSFLSRESILIWAIKSYPQKKKSYPELLKQADFAHLHVVRISNPAEVRRFLLRAKANKQSNFTT